MHSLANALAYLTADKQESSSLTRTEYAAIRLMPVMSSPLRYKSHRDAGRSLQQPDVNAAVKQQQGETASSCRWTGTGEKRSHVAETAHSNNSWEAEEEMKAGVPSPSPSDPLRGSRGADVGEAFASSGPASVRDGASAERPRCK